MTATSHPSGGSLKALREEAADCRACPLWKDATQTVFGEGPQHAQVMLVGEQPGDKEDLAGKPFVGPAGQMLDRALEEAGIERDEGLCHQRGEAFQIRAARQNSACTRSRTRPRSGHAGHGTNANWLRSNPRWWWRWAPPPRKACSARSRRSTKIAAA